MFEKSSSLKDSSRSKGVRSRNRWMQHGGGAGGDAVAPLEQRGQGGKRSRDAISAPCRNKLMNDNRSLIEGTEAIPSTGSDAANGVLRVAMVMEAERLWRPPDPSWSQIIVYTCSQQSAPPFGWIYAHEYL